MGYRGIFNIPKAIFYLIKGDFWITHGRDVCVAVRVFVCLRGSGSNKTQFHPCTKSKMQKHAQASAAKDTQPPPNNEINQQQQVQFSSTIQVRVAILGVLVIPKREMFKLNPVQFLRGTLFSL